MRFTVFTPTYNRGHLIKELYNSLCRQSFHDFEWIIIDDGSTDNTEEVVREIKSNDYFFPILYKKIPNGGKHRAWNLGVGLASGELFFGCDSDDILTDNALEIADRVEKTIKKEDKINFAGVCGLKGDKSSKIIGTSFDGKDYLDMTYFERERNNTTGDKSEVFYTAVWKKYKYHEFDSENFLTEATSLFRMADDGLKIRFFNSVIKVCEYRPDGLTANSREKFASNPKGWGLYIYQRIKYGMLKDPGKWDVIFDYYDCCRNRLSISQMAKNLHMPTLKLATKVFRNKCGNRIKRIWKQTFNK